MGLHDTLAKVAVSLHQSRPSDRLLRSAGLAGLRATRLVECAMAGCAGEDAESCDHPPYYGRVANVLWAVIDGVRLAAAAASKYAGILRLMYGPHDKDVLRCEAIVAAAAAAGRGRGATAEGKRR